MVDASSTRSRWTPLSERSLFLRRRNRARHELLGELIRITLPDEQVLRRQIATNGISSAARSGDHAVVTSYDGSVYLVRPTDLAIANELAAMRQRVDEHGRPV